MCLLENGVHEGHQRASLKELAPNVLSRLRLLNDGLGEKRRQMEESAQNIQQEINDLGETV